MKKKIRTTTGEMLKMFGIMILITRYDFTSCASIWSTTAPYKYIWQLHTLLRQACQGNVSVT